MLEHEGQVEDAGAQPGEGGAAVDQLVHQPDARVVTVQQRPGLGREVYQRGEEGAEPDGAPPQALQGQHVVLGPLELTEHEVGVCEEDATSLGGTTPRRVRRTSTVPRWRSSTPICRETAGCVRCSSRAARENDPSVATVLSVRSLTGSSMRGTLLSPRSS